MRETAQVQIPLLKDHHTHPSQYAAFFDCLNLQAITGKTQALGAMETLQDDVNIVLGWNDSYYTFSYHELDRFPPMILCNLSLHRFIFNAQAKQLFRGTYDTIIANVENPDWLEQHPAALIRFFLELKPLTKELLTDFYRWLLRQGVYYAEEMTLPNEQVHRLYHDTGLRSRTSFWAHPDVFEELPKTVQSDVSGLKIYTDGALGARTAAITEPYNSGEPGLLTHTDDHLLQLIKQGAILEKPMAIHAIGDRATQQVVRVLERSYRSGIDVNGVRIEHCQFISKSTAQKAKALGCILCMQPNFSTDSIHYRDRLPEHYWAVNNPFRMLIDEISFVPGEDLLLGSDGMPHGAEYALNAALFPSYPGQRLTIDEFVGAYCLTNDSYGTLDLLIDHSEKRVHISLE